MITPKELAEQFPLREIVSDAEAAGFTDTKKSWSAARKDAASDMALVGLRMTKRQQDKLFEPYVSPWPVREVEPRDHASYELKHKECTGLSEMRPDIGDTAQNGATNGPSDASDITPSPKLKRRITGAELHAIRVEELRKKKVMQTLTKTEAAHIEELRKRGGDEKFRIELDIAAYRDRVHAARAEEIARETPEQGAERARDKAARVEKRAREKAAREEQVAAARESFRKASEIKSVRAELDSMAKRHSRLEHLANPPELAEATDRSDWYRDDIEISTTPSQLGFLSSAIKFAVGDKPE